jgi:hypothetical protein
VGISQWLSYTLSAVPSGSPIAFKNISQWLLAKTRRFLPIFLEAAFFTFINVKKTKANKEILKTLSGSYPNTDLSNNLTLGQPQSRATVPLSSISENTE